MRNKWTSFVKLGVLLTSLFVIFVINTKNTSAYNLGNTGSVPVYGIQTWGTKGGSDVYFEQYVQNSNGVLQVKVTDKSGVQSNTNIEQIGLDFGVNSNFYLPANSIFNFSIEIYTDGTEALSPAAEQAIGNWTIIDKSCNTPTENYGHQLFCTYWGYTGDSPINTLLFVGSWQFPYSDSYITVYPSVTYANVLDSGGSGGGSVSGDWVTETGLHNQLNGEFRTYLEIKFNQLHSNGLDQLSTLNQMKALIQSINTDSSDTKQIIQDLKDQDQEDRDNLEQQSSDAQDSADDSQSDAQSTGTTLLSAFTAFVGALTNANPSNCNIDMDMGNLDLGVVNFCQLNPPPGFTTLSSIFLILFCVPLSIATARKVINLFRSFQS